jgi:hypothetical protein
LQWSALPAHPTELILYVAGFGSPRKVGPNTTFTPIVAESLTVGIDPELSGLSTGPIPTGARRLVEQGTPPCPTRGQEREFLFRLFALGAGQSIPQDLVQHNSVTKILNRRYSAEVADGEFTTEH